METRRLIGLAHRAGWSRLVVMIGLVAFVAVVYVAVVLGGGAVLGRTESPSLTLSVLATAAVALLFAPVQAVLERFAARMGPGGSAAPYEVLSRFSETVTGGYPTEELPGRMSMLLAQGTGAQWAQVWLIVSDRLILAATWPPNAAQDRTPPSLEPDGIDGIDGIDGPAAGRRVLTVRHGGQPLGVLRLQERPGLALTAVEERLFAGLAAQAGLVLRLAGLRAELEGRHEELVVRADQLQASRKRLIETQDAERRRLERDIHDGAQQHLVALTVNLRLAQTIGVHSPERATDVVARQVEPARVAIQTLTSLSRGIYPSVLSDDGLVTALRSAVGSSAIPVAIEAGDVGRLPASIEAALYFCCMEAVQNAAKHSGAGTVTVRLSEDEDRWRLVVADDGSGFDQSRVRADGGGAGLMNMRDRLDAVGGTVTFGSRSGEGTTVTALVPMTRGG